VPLAVMLPPVAVRPPVALAPTAAVVPPVLAPVALAPTPVPGVPVVVPPPGVLPQPEAPLNANASRAASREKESLTWRRNLSAHQGAGQVIRRTLMPPLHQSKRSERRAKGGNSTSCSAARESNSREAGSTPSRLTPSNQLKVF
jgi:hypothetical protein